MCKNYFKNRTLLPFKNNYFMLQYLIFSEKQVIKKNSNIFLTPEKNSSVFLTPEKNKFQTNLEEKKNFQKIDENEDEKMDIDELDINKMDIDDNKLIYDEKCEIEFPDCKSTINCNNESEIISKNKNYDSKNNEEIIISKNELNLTKLMKFLIGVSGIGKTSHIISKIKNGYHLIYLSCGDATDDKFQIYDSCTKSFIDKCINFYYGCLDQFIESLDNKENKDEIKRNIMVNYCIFYFFLRIVLFYYEKEILKWDSKKIFYSQINGNSFSNKFILDYLINDVYFYKNYDFEKLISSFSFLIDENLIFAIDELQLLTDKLINCFCGRKNKERKRSLLSIVVEAISKFYYLERYLAGTGMKILNHDELQSGAGLKLDQIIDRSVCFLKNVDECWNYLNKYVKISQSCKNLKCLKDLVGRKRICSKTLFYLINNRKSDKNEINQTELSFAINSAFFDFVNYFEKKINDYINDKFINEKRSILNILFYVVYKIGNFFFF
jgi:hypothetical protein